MHATDPTGIEGAWQRLESDWNNDEAHRRFLALCALHGVLDQAGQRYRAVRDADPARKEEAGRRLQAIMTLALEQLAKTRTPEPARKRRIVWLLVGACGFVIVRAVLALLRLRSQ